MRGYEQPKSQREGKQAEGGPSDWLMSVPEMLVDTLTHEIWPQDAGAHHRDGEDHRETSPNDSDPGEPQVDVVSEVAAPREVSHVDPKAEQERGLEEGAGVAEERPAGGEVLPIAVLPIVDVATVGIRSIVGQARVLVQS